MSETIHVFLDPKDVIGRIILNVGAGKVKGVVLNGKSGWNRHKNITISWGLCIGIYIINLTALKISEKTKDEYETDGPPIDNRSVGLPEMLAFNLMATVRTDPSFVFQDGPIRCSFTTEAPNCWKDF